MKIPGNLYETFVKTLQYLRANFYRYNNRQVQGIDIGYRYQGGKRTDEAAVRLHFLNDIQYVTQSLRPAPRFSEVLISAPYRPWQASYVAPSDPRRTWALPVIQPGISTGRVECGTLGMICKDNQTGMACILSCFHVLRAGPGDRIPQPSAVIDKGTAANTIALYYKGILDNKSDAAIARLVSARPVNPAQYGTSDIIRQASLPQLGMRVRKSGRTTAVTEGIIDGTGIYVLNYAGIGQREIEGFRIVPEDPMNAAGLEIGAPGDSGALWYDPVNLSGIGLNVGGETDGSAAAEMAIACNLTQVFQTLSISPYS